MNLKVERALCVKEGHQKGQSRVILRKTLIGRILFKKLKIEFVRTSFENRLFY